MMTFLTYGLLGLVVLLFYRWLRVRFCPDALYFADKEEPAPTPIRRIRVNTAL